MAAETERSVRSTKDGQLLHEMRRGVAEGAEGGSGGGDEKAAHDRGVRSLCSVGEGICEWRQRRIGPGGAQGRQLLHEMRRGAAEEQREARRWR